jgi:protein involved in polysaccharide export with SLBB domain
MAKFRLAAVVILAVMSGWPVSAADRPNPARTTVDESVGTIEKRDLLRVSINGLQGPGAMTHKETRVDEQGNAALPIVGRLKLAGLTTARAERAIATAYKEKNLIQNAVVDVKRLEAGARMKEGVGTLAAGDLVAVAIDELTGPAVTSEFRSHVAEDGSVRLPYVGLLKLGGLGEGAAEDVVRKAYAKDIIRNPVVSVRVIEPAAEANVKPGPVANGDLLDVTIWELAGPATPTRLDVRVDDDGRAAFPYVGPTKLAGLSEAAAAEAVVKRYREAHLIQNPILSLSRARSADASDVKRGPVARGDVLRVSVWELNGPGVETRKVVKVDDEGKVTLPLIDVKVEGLREADVPAAIAKAYREQNLIAHAMVAALKVNGDAPLAVEDLDPPPAPARPEAQSPRPAKATVKRK